MSQIKPEEGKRTFYRSVFFRDVDTGVNGRQRWYLGADGQATLDPSVAYVGELPPALTQGYTQGQIKVVLSSPSSSADTFIKPGERNFVVVRLPAPTPHRGSGNTSYVGPNSLVDQPEQARIFSDASDAYMVVEYLYPHAVVEQNRFLQSKIAFFGATLDGISGMSVKQGVLQPIFA